MKEYLLGLFVLAVCCSVVELLGTKGALAGHIKLMSGLCALCVMIAPISNLVSEGLHLPELFDNWTQEFLDSLENGEQEYEERWQEEGERLDIDLAQQTVAGMLCQRFSFQIEDCRVEITPDASKTGIQELRVALSGKAIWANTHEIREYVNQTLGCPSTVYIE